MQNQSNGHDLLFTSPNLNTVITSIQAEAPIQRLVAYAESKYEYQYGDLSGGFPGALKAREQLLLQQQEVEREREKAQRKREREREREKEREK